MSIGSNKVVIQPPKEIDPNFYIPYGMTDLVYEGTTEVDEETPEDSIVEEDSDLNDEGEDYEIEGTYGDIDEDTDERPDAPNSIAVVEQRIRVSEDGSHVVDIVLEVEEGTSGEYDVRVTKI